MVSFIMLAALIISVSSNLNCPSRQSIEESLKQVHIPGAAIVVVNAAGTVYEQAFGYQSLLPPEPIATDRSIFALGSISKTFIAVAVMQLVEQELVDLDTDVNQYLGVPGRVIYHRNFPNHSITLRRLLSHSSSIAVNGQLQSTFFQPGDSAQAKETLAELCFKYLNANTTHWLARPLGSVTLYSNEGASLAALVVERITRMPYHQYVKDKIFEPLNISQLGVYLSNFSNESNLVKHYAYAPNASFLPLWNAEFPQLNGNLSSWLHIPFFGFSGYPAGLFRMSARSLAAFLRMFVNRGHPLLSSRSIEEMKIIVGNSLIYPYNPDAVANSIQQVPPPRRYGLCWHWRTLSDGRQYLGHGASMPGVTHLMLVNAKHNTGVLVLTNSDTNAPTELTSKIYETIEHIHVFFQCFETNDGNSVFCHSKLFMVTCCFLLVFAR